MFCNLEGACFLRCRNLVHWVLFLLPFPVGFDPKQSGAFLPHRGTAEDVVHTVMAQLQGDPVRALLRFRLGDDLGEEVRKLQSPRWVAV